MKKRFLLQQTALSVSLVLYMSACSDSSSSSAGSGFNGGSGNGGGVVTEFDESTLVANLTNNVITPTFQNFGSLTTQLHQSVDQYCNLEKSFNAGNATEQARDDQKLLTQNQWKDSMSEWQKIEVMQLGPLITDQSSLRNKIYSWPVVNTCAVDQDVTFFNEGTINGAPYDIKQRVVTRRGLDALEYLLFNTVLDHSCTASTAPAGWDSLTDNQRREWRCQFATEVAKDVADNTQVLLDGWSGSGGYAQSLLNAASQPGSDFANVHEAVNRISDAMFYVDSVTKDAKLGVPLGISDNSCQQNICPQDLESQFANQSLANIRSNLVSLKALFTGELATGNASDTTGFDDFLVEEGAQTTATEILGAIDAAIANVDAYQENLSDTIQSDATQVQATHAQVKAITDQLKEDFINQLSLELPASSAGDND
ncbi:imelysin family protein [Aliikangiella coralliicola]|uniref:Imelysin family protein n=1 Tax=Aliikangiella coralliicola TaxID=2592383 RepID=A0A545UC98_9GAMM|nr:imelysin family protein [Aliikangiella coralliicola]TQV87092.1 imelysin family protein [Aliikangiella coralliicola]